MIYLRRTFGLMVIALIVVLSGLAWLQPAGVARAARLNQQVKAEPTGEATPTAELPTEITDEPTTEPTIELTAEPTEPAAISPTLEIPLEPTVEKTTEPTATPTETTTPEATTAPEEDDRSTGAEVDITGQVVAEGRAGDNQAGHQVTMANDQGTVLSVETASDGRFSLVDAPAGDYILAASSPGFLAARCEGVSQVGALLQLDQVYLLAGDLDNSGEIDIIDAVALGAAFGQSVSGVLADLNLDGEVDILDFVLMAANFGQNSTAHPWPCQAIATP
jgi:hypothetical protein